MRLRRVTLDTLSWTRRRCGRGFTFLDERGRRLDDDQQARCKVLAIPPAWTDVRICPLPNGHLQAVGTDDAGRQQYLYHSQWRDRQDRVKHDRVLDVGRRLPTARRRVAQHLALGEMSKQRALATAFRLLDLGLFRVGGEQYADQHGSYGLATLEKRHVRIGDGTIVFDYPAKSGQRRRVEIVDPAVHRAVVELRRRRSGGSQLLAYRDPDGWHDVTSRDINAYVKEMLGSDVSTKDFRTWHGTVAAAAALAEESANSADAASQRSIRRASERVADELGNTPAVARKSYIDPRLVDHFEGGETISAEGGGAKAGTRRRSEQAVLRLLQSGSDS
jgi:DNA topoisomerase I